MYIYSALIDMDLLQFLPEYRVLICKPCRKGLLPGKLFSHFRKLHMADSPPLASIKSIRLLIDEVLPTHMDQPLLDPSKEPPLFPPADCDALPWLPIHDGWGCNYCHFVRKSVVDMRKHYNSAHARVRRRRGGASHGAAKARYDEEHFGGEEPWHRASYQRYWSGGSGCNIFRVRSPAQRQREDEDRERARRRCVLNERDFVTDDVLHSLSVLEARDAKRDARVTGGKETLQVSPWLERTRWLKLFDGVSFAEILPLADRPDPATEPALKAIADSLDRLVEAGYRSVCEDRINAFAQRRINSFLPDRKMFNQPLMVKLQKATYYRYKDTWKRLLCFAYRSRGRDGQPLLCYCLTSQ